MKKWWVRKVLKVVVIAAVACIGGGYVVMALWNWLAPPVFGGHLITFWQALGLLVLCRILFGKFGGWHGGHAHMRHRLRERWEKMPPEERDKLRNAMRERCGRQPAQSETA